jgi:hypothetical protein
MDRVEYWDRWYDHSRFSVEELIKKTVDFHTDRHKWNLSLKGIREAPTIDQESGGRV